MMIQSELEINYRWFKGDIYRINLHSQHPHWLQQRTTFDERRTSMDRYRVCVSGFCLFTQPDITWAAPRTERGLYEHKARHKEAYKASQWVLDIKR